MKKERDHKSGEPPHHRHQHSACLDRESGLYHQAHFMSALKLEVARVDRWEKPMSLVLLTAAGHISASGWRILGGLILDHLRSIDLAARLGSSESGVIMPDADGFKARRWLRDLDAAIKKEPALSGLELKFGLAQLRPWEHHSPEKLLALAHQGQTHLDARIDDDPLPSPSSAIAADERNLLFAGFQSLGSTA